MARKRKWHVRTQREPKPSELGSIAPPPRALIVEDDPAVARMYAKLLAMDGWGSHTAVDVDSALNILAEVHFDLIVLDLRLPGEPGDALVRKLRAAGSEAMILVATGVPGFEREVALLSAGADAYLRKPFETGVFIAHVRALHRRPRSMRTMVRFDGDLTLDPVRHHVIWCGARAHLAATKFGLLWLVAGNPGAYFSTAKLCIELKGAHTRAIAKNIYEHMEQAAAFVRELTSCRLKLASEANVGYVLRRDEGLGHDLTSARIADAPRPLHRC